MINLLIAALLLVLPVHDGEIAADPPPVSAPVAPAPPCVTFDLCGTDRMDFEPGTYSGQFYTEYQGRIRIAFGECQFIAEPAGDWPGYFSGWLICDLSGQTDVTVEGAMVSIRICREGN